MSKCKNKDCGCRDSALTISPNFSNDPTVCPPNSEQCTEVFDMACICYQGDDIVEYDIQRGDRLDEVLQKLILALRSPGCSTFEDPTSCQSVLNLTIANLTDTSFDISWDASPIATSYVVEFKEAAALSWNLNPAVTAPTIADTVIGLTADTVYDVRVNAVCPSGTCYSLNIRIKTLPTPA
jgi:hypothetical protein